MKTLLALSFLFLSACGSSGGGSSGAGGSSTPVSNSNLHTYEMQVTGQDTDFNFAPVILGTNSNQVSPGPQTVVLGQTLSYTITDSQADFQMTGISDVENNGAFYVSVVVLKDGVPVVSFNVGVGISWNTGTI